MRSPKFTLIDATETFTEEEIKVAEGLIVPLNDLVLEQEEEEEQHERDANTFWVGVGLAYGTLVAMYISNSEDQEAAAKLIEQVVYGLRSQEEPKPKPGMN